MNAEESQRRRRRGRLLKGLVLGGAAIGLPALANRFVARNAPRPKAAQWGRGRVLSWGGGRVAYQELGAGDQTVVLLHSFGPGHDGAEWRIVAEEVAKRARVLVPDLPGWGRSGHPGLFANASLYRVFLRDFLREVAGQTTLLAGADCAAAYAVQLVAEDPQLARSLLLVTPRGLRYRAAPKDLGDHIVQNLVRLPVLGTSALNYFTSRTNLARYLEQEVFAHPERVDAALIDHHYRSSHLRGTHPALRAWIEGRLRLDVGEILGRVTVPTFLAWGRHAVDPPVETADLWLQHRGDAELEVFPGSGTLPHAEEPGAFATYLSHCLDELGET